MAGGIMMGVTGGSAVLRDAEGPLHAASAAIASAPAVPRRNGRMPHCSPAASPHAACDDVHCTHVRFASVMALDARRTLARCDALAAHSEQPDGLTRIFLSPEQRAVNDHVLAWMREAGMQARLDAIGNCVGRYEGVRAGLPSLMLGSHLDTVRDAGRYDGMLGVIAAIECVAALGGKRLPFAIEVVGFGDEEGVRFGSTLLGSRAVA